MNGTLIANVNGTEYPVAYALTSPGWGFYLGFATVNVPLKGNGTDSIKLYDSVGYIWLDYINLSLTNEAAPSVVFGKYNISSEKVVTYIAPNTTVNSFISPVTIANGAKLVFSDTARGQYAATDTIATTGTVLIGTGTTVDVMENGVKTNTFTLRIYGDVNGDGKIDLNDLTAIRDSLINKNQLVGAYAKAGDLYGESNLTLNDLVGVMASVSGSGSISQFP